MQKAGINEICALKQKTVKQQQKQTKNPENPQWSQFDKFKFFTINGHESD